VRVIFAALAALLGLPGCAAQDTLRGEGGFCTPPAAVAESIVPDPPSPAASRAEQAAALLGMRSLFALDSRRVLDVEARMRVVERIDLARLAIAATVAELDCEGERARQAANFLERAQGNKVQALTVASIAAAALTGIAGVLLSTRNASAAAQDTVAIAGGGITAGLGLATLHVHPTLSFAHARNLLTDVWAGPATSATYPALVWAYLARPEFSNDQTRSIRVRIVERWHHFESIADDRALEALLFGGGGRYGADALRVRAAMLDEVKAEVSLANQDLSAAAATLLSVGPP
jgi:hypothetical protein